MQKFKLAPHKAPLLVLSGQPVATMVPLKGARRYMSDGEVIANRSHRMRLKQAPFAKNQLSKYDDWALEVCAGRYAPFLTTRSFPAGLGSKSMEFSATEGRSRHLLSHGEMYLCHMLENLPHVIEIQEQFAVPPDLSMVIADELGFALPRYGNSQIVTSDFKVKFRFENHTYWTILSFKPFDVLSRAQELGEERAREKLLIECHYWETRVGIPWTLITGIDVSPVLDYNLQFFREAAEQAHCVLLQDLSKETIDAFSQRFCQHLSQYPYSKTNDLIKATAADLSFEYPRALCVFKHLAWQRRLPINLLKPVELNMPIPVISQ